MITDQEQPILADFGLSKIVSAERLTESGILSGTPAYMSPEQCQGETGDERSDIYSMGVMLYELATGDLPFHGDTPVGLLLKHISEPLPPPRSINPDLPHALEQVIRKAMEKGPADRFQSAQEMLDALHRVTPSTEPVSLETEPLPAVDDRCPYRGLEVFQQQHAEFYFGREALIEHLANKLQGSDARFLAVLGPSGSGKSSVVRAGLIPAIRAGALPGSEGWTMHLFRPGSNPLEELATQLAPTLDREGDQLGAARRLLDHLSADGRALHLAAKLALQDVPSGRHLLLLVDQFEEIFTLCKDEQERERFIGSLLYASTVRDGPIHVVLAMRADFYPHCAVHRDLARQIAEHQVLVGPMSRDELRRAVERPAWRVGLRFEPGLVDLLLHDVHNQPGCLPLLQHALLELWKRREGRQLSLAVYRDIGGVEGALERQAETLFGQFSAPEQAICQRIFLRLTQPGKGTEDTKRRVSLQEALPVEGSAREAAQAVIHRLVDARLITAERGPGSGERFIEVAHEALIRNWSRLQGWIEGDRTALLAHRQLTDAASDWDRQERDPSYLYLDTRLERAKEWAIERLEDLSLLERQFLTASALHDADPEAMVWCGGLPAAHGLAIVRETLLSGKLAVEANQTAIRALGLWAGEDRDTRCEPVLDILRLVASGDADPSVRLVALETAKDLGGREAVTAWWNNQPTATAGGIQLLARLWDRGIQVLPKDGKTRWRLYRTVLWNRLLSRRTYLLRWTLYGAIGSALTSLVAGLLGMELPTATSGAVLISALSGLGQSIGLAIGELFEGRLKGLARTLAGVVTVYSAGLFASILIRIAQARGIDLMTTALASSLLYTLAAGVGTALGQLLPKRGNLGYIALGSLAVILMHRLLEWPLGALISLGVVLGTGTAQILHTKTSD
jgi:hypothetical protein